MKTLGVLICTIPERDEKFGKLYNKISSLATSNVTIYFDSTVRYDEVGGISVGEKRQKLINSCDCDYFVFVDDDDDITNDFFSVINENLEQNADVICYNVKALIDGKEHIIDQSIHNEIEQLKEGITKRFPSVMACYKTELAKKNKFKPLNNGEDFEWSKSLNLKSEVYLKNILQIYNFNSKDTVASSAINRAIVTFSNTDKYAKQVEIQKQSCKEFAKDIPHFHFTNYDEIGCKSHSEYPYSFKPYAIHKVREMGYNNILWIDSPVHFVKDSKEIFNYIKNNKILLFNNTNYSIGSYTNDTCLSHFNMNREEANNLPMVMACAMGFDFRDENIRNVFDTYLGFAHTNAYQGDWQTHRHDQSVISCIAARKGIKLIEPFGSFLIYDGNKYHEERMKESVCLISKSI